MSAAIADCVQRMTPAEATALVASLPAEIGALDAEEAAVLARALIADGYCQISRRHRTLARLRAGIDGRKALLLASQPKAADWVKGLSDWMATEQYIRFHAPVDEKSECVVDRLTFEAFRKLGGGAHDR